MDWAKGYLLITLAAFLCEYIRLRVDYHILEIAIMVAAAPLAIFAICAPDEASQKEGPASSGCQAPFSCSVIG